MPFNVCTVGELFASKHGNASTWILRIVISEQGEDEENDLEIRGGKGLGVFL